MPDGGKRAIWILSLDNAKLEDLSKVKITEDIGGFTDLLTTGINPNETSGANYGHALCAVRDIDGGGINDLITGANQQYEGWGYLLYLNLDKTVKSFTGINNTEGGFDLHLTAEGRFSQSISYVGDLKGDGSIAINFGGNAGGAGTLYTLFLTPQ